MGSMWSKAEKNNEIIHAGTQSSVNAVIIQGDNNTLQNVQQGNVQNSNSTQTTSDTKRIREKLKDAYQDLRLPMVSWMQRGSGNFLVGHHFIQLQLHKGNETSTTKHGEEIELRNIFEGRILDETTDLQILFGDYERPNRILIESQPGFGKTTLAHKIIHDWVKDEEYVSHFDLAILITLRSLKTKTATKLVEDVVREKTKIVINGDSNQWEMINNDKTLLVLDGLDEVDDQCKENVLNVLYDTFMNKVVIVVTCRSGLFELDDEYVNVVHGGAKKGDKFWDEKISISGITKKNRTKFLKTYLKKENERQTLKRIKNILNQFNDSSVWDESDDDDEMWTDLDSDEEDEIRTDLDSDEEDEIQTDEDDEINDNYDGNLNRMFKSPLVLILLIFIVERTCQVTIKTKTDLFKNLVDCIIRRSAAKRQTFLKANFTIFVEHLNDSISKEYLELFEKFGNMAMDRILKGDLHFDCDSDTEKIYEMGFFIKHEQRNKFESLQHYECFHLSILEFAAAFSIWRNFLSSGKILKTSDRDKMNVVCRKKGATSLVIPFLFGLMGKDGKELLSQLSDCNLLYNTEKALMELVFTECDMDDDWRDVVTNFVPSELEFSNDSLFVITPMLNKCLVKLCMSSSDVWLLNESLGIKFLELEVDTWVNLNPNVIDRIKCEHLLLKFSSSLQFYDDSNLENLKKIVSISAHSREVFITNDVQKDILQYVNSQIFDDVVLDELEVAALHVYDVSNNEFTQKLIASITKHVTANHLSVQFKYGTNADTLDYCLSVVCKSSSIKSISLFNDCGFEKRINFDLITDNGQKKWTTLMLNNVYVDRHLDHSYCIDTENFFISTDDADVLKQVAPRRLGCTDELLRSVASDSQWRGWESVIELTLMFGWKCVSTEIPNLSYLCGFKRLTSVTLYVCYIETLFRTSLIDIGRELNYTRKIRIFIKIHYERHLVALLDYIKDVIKNEEFNSSQRIVLLIYFEVNDRNAHWDITESLNFIMATAPNLRFKFCFVKKWYVDSFLAKNIIDYSACSVAYKIYPLYSSWKYLNYFFFEHAYSGLDDYILRILCLRKR